MPFGGFVVGSDDPDAEQAVDQREQPVQDVLVREVRPQLLLGEIAGRTAPEQISLFKSVGLAMQDAVTAAWIYRAAVAREMGQQVGL